MKKRDHVAELQQMLDEAGMRATLYGHPVNLVDLRNSMLAPKPGEIEEAARRFIFWRRVKLDLRNHRNALHHECPEADCDEGPLACCVFSGWDESEWCPKCMESNVAHQWQKMAASKAAGALRRLENAVSRSKP